MGLLEIMCVVNAVIHLFLLWLTFLLPLLFLQQFLCLYNGLLILPDVYHGFSFVACLGMAQERHVHALIGDLTHECVVLAVGLILIVSIASSITTEFQIDIIRLLGHRFKLVLNGFLLFQAGFTDGLLLVNEKNLLGGRACVVEQSSFPGHRGTIVILVPFRWI